MAITIGTLDQDLWMASPPQATAKTETRTVKVLGVPVTVMGKTTWTTGPSTVTGTQVALTIGILAAVAGLVAALVIAARILI
jgi:hypothetical protein